MPVEANQSLLHYRIVDKLGEGGMGEVWRAVDTTLDREVAIKVLPESVSAEGERALRFEREARVLASLNHQNIATIHGFHNATLDDGLQIHFLAMELVEGEDLEERIQREPVPLERTIEIATQVATALEAAHAQGIVHRDLKPANVKLTASGDAKVLDFGLAKALAPEGASGDAAMSPSMSPTLTSAGTMAGMILGTAAYMSPEQARGKTVDRRTDLWAFGCLIFEMLTQKRCFSGETISDTLASVLKEEPDWELLPDGTPTAIRRLLRRCLSKDPRQRLSDAADARLELSEAFERHEVVEAPAIQAPAKNGKLPWILTAAAVLAALGATMFGMREPDTAPSELLELSIPINNGMRLNSDQESLLDISPDGRYVAFSAWVESTSAAIYLRKLDDSTIVRLPDTAGAINPFFSPDSEWIGFFADGKMKKIRVDGTSAIEICEARGNPRGASWGDDDLIVFPTHFAGGLSRVSSSGGEPATLTELDTDRRERTHRWPQIVPGHDVVLYTVATTDSPEFYDDARIDAVRLSTGERKTVFEGASLARYVATGHLVFGRGGFLYAVPFDIDRLEAIGTPVPVVSEVTGAKNSGSVYAAVSTGGLLAFVPGKPENAKRELRLLFPDGREEKVAETVVGAMIDPALSPDGKRVAISMAGERSRDIWVFDLENESRVRLTFSGDNSLPIWTTDGKRVIFSSIRDGSGAAYITAADGSGGERLVHHIEGSTLVAFDISQDDRLVTLEVYGNAKTDIYVKSLVDPDAPAVPFLAGTADERHPHFSPDDRWVAYVSDEAGDYEVFVRPYPGPGGQWQISEGGGIDPRWSPDGKQIHYRSNAAWWVVEIESGEGRPFRTGTPRMVRNDLPRAQLQFSHGMSLAGEALLVTVSEDERQAADEIRVIVNWLDELERLVD